MQVTHQLLACVLPWLLIRILVSLIDLIVSRKNNDNLRFHNLSLGFAAVFLNGACLTGALIGFLITTDQSAWSRMAV